MLVAQKVRAIGENRTVRIDLRAAGCLIAPALIVFANGAAAIGLGPAELRSGLGEPLRLSLPVTLQSGENVGCVQVKPHGDDLPAVFNTRAAVVQVRGQTRVEISSAQPVNEPAVGLIVSAGCASPVARDYVVFLDPPLVPAAALVRDVPVDADASARPTPPTARAESNARSETPSNAARRAASKRGSATATRGKDSLAASAPPRTRRPVAPVAARDTARETLPRKVRLPIADATARIPDRLTVAPVEGPRAGSGRAEKPGSAGAPSGIDVARSAAISLAAQSTPAQSTSASTAATAATATSIPNAAGDQAARDEDQQRVQRELQLQIKVLGDQVLALRNETAALNARNQALADSAFPRFLGWIFGLLALVAIALAAWIAWRYSQLRRAVAGDPWWGTTVFGASPVAAPREQAASDPVPVPAVRGPVPPASGKTASATPVRHVADYPAGSIPGASERVKPSTWSGGKNYAAALESDFTVSDIEAAMATVRTVPPPRAPSATSMEESDFSPLGGPSLPSPFTEPPPPKSTAGTEDESAHLDFSLDISPPPATVGTNVPVDPLAITSHQTTEVDPPQAIDFELPLAPSALDFELPAASTAGGASSDTADDDDADHPMRHAASVLDDIFPPPSVDTILRLDDPGADSMTSTEVEAHEREAEQASLKLRLARFADLIDQVDETALTDPLRAIAQLRQHVLRDELIPSLMWLRLFELYRRVDKKPVYEALTEHFARRYHRPMVKWDESLADLTPQVGLSALPEIDRNIEAKWGTEFGLDMLRSLLCDRDQPDAVVFNAVLQRELLEAAKVFPLDDHQKSNLGHNL